ncbi:hypothetical protein [Streptomyces sp. NPDC051561]|uniref:hypothetical protein n=1 Tax=Streptomyces sp. NPDC051561 TaxID=3365658 RepID=UPI0037920707
MSDDFEYRMQKTDRQVRDLDSRLDDLESEQESLKGRFGYTDDLDYELRKIRSDISECEEKVERVDEIEEELGDRVTTAEQAVRRLTQHVRLLEGQIMSAGGASAADLDTFTTDQRALAGALQSGWDAADALLSEDVRDMHRRQVNRFQDAQARHRGARGEVVELVGALTDSRYGTQGHTDTATQLRSAIASEATLQQGLPRQSSQAKTAAAALAADTAARADKQPALAAGARAEKRLTLALRSRLAEAVSNRLLLPAWFVTVLGPAPPARGTEQWLERATRVLLYRLTYAINDQVLALGPQPDTADQHRHQWHKELLKDLHRW